MFGEPMDSILAAVGGVWLLCSVAAVPFLWWRHIEKGRQHAFRSAVDTVAVWTNRVVVVVALILVALHYIDIMYGWWGLWSWVVAGGLLVWILLALVGAKMWHKQERDTDPADRLDTDPGVGDSPPNSPA